MEKTAQTVLLYAEHATMLLKILMQKSFNMKPQSTLTAKLLLKTQQAALTAIQARAISSL
jgi:hypothetical protein